MPAIAGIFICPFFFFFEHFWLRALTFLAQCAQFIYHRQKMRRKFDMVFALTNKLLGVADNRPAERWPIDTAILANTTRQPVLPDLYPSLGLWYKDTVATLSGRMVTLRLP